MCGGGIKEQITALEGFVWMWETYVKLGTEKGGNTKQCLLRGLSGALYKKMAKTEQLELQLYWQMTDSLHLLHLTT